MGAASNPPTPAPTESTGKPKSNTTQVNQGSKSSDSVTKSSSALIAAPKSPGINIKATDKTENGGRYSSPEWWMIYLTAALTIITACLWSATKTIVDRSYITTHRPRLIVRRISLAGWNRDWFTPGSKIRKIQFIVANIGGSRTTITEVNDPEYEYSD